MLRWDELELVFEAVPHSPRMHGSKCAFWSERDLVGIFR
jgi:hypothetical protein